MRSLFLVMCLIVAAGCSTGSSVSNSAAVERENTEGKELRNKLESGPTVK